MFKRIKYHFQMMEVPYHVTATNIHDTFFYTGKYNSNRWKISSFNSNLYENKELTNDMAAMNLRACTNVMADFS